jgi:four helix bundle protein
MNIDLDKRIFDFTIRVILFLRKLPNDIELRDIKRQLIKAVTSVGANYEEAQAASSRADFKNKLNIALNEIREAKYWLKIIAAIEDVHGDDIKSIQNEAKELMLILGSITSKISNNIRPNQT